MKDTDDKDTKEFTKELISSLNRKTVFSGSSNYYFNSNSQIQANIQKSSGSSFYPKEVKEVPVQGEVSVNGQVQGQVQVNGQVLVLGQAQGDSNKNQATCNNNNVNKSFTSNISNYSRNITDTKANEKLRNKIPVSIVSSASTFNKSSAKTKVIKRPANKIITK